MPDNFRQTVDLKKKLVKTTISRQLKFLEKHKEDHVQILEQSIQNGWQGLFVIKQQSTYKHKETQVGSLNWQIAQETKQEFIDVQN